MKKNRCHKFEVSTKSNQQSFSFARNGIVGNHDTLDGRNPAPVDKYFIPLFTSVHPRWCRISSINNKDTNQIEQKAQ